MRHPSSPVRISGHYVYESLEQLQADVDAWVESDNAERTHSGKYCYG